MKKVNWERNYKPVTPKKEGYGSYREFAKAQREKHSKQEQAREALLKATPILTSMLVNRMAEREPIKVTRPLAYTVEVLENEKDYYDEVVSSQFVFKSKTIPVGTNLVFDKLEKSLNKLVFKGDQRGFEEVEIDLTEQGQLITQTDIYDSYHRAMEIMHENKEIDNG